MSEAFPRRSRHRYWLEVWHGDFAFDVQRWGPFADRHEAIAVMESLAMNESVKKVRIRHERVKRKRARSQS